MCHVQLALPPPQLAKLRAVIGSLKSCRLWPRPLDRPPLIPPSHARACAHLPELCEVPNVAVLLCDVQRRVAARVGRHDGGAPAPLQQQAQQLQAALACSDVEHCLPVPARARGGGGAQGAVRGTGGGGQCGALSARIDN